MSISSSVIHSSSGKNYGTGGPWDSPKDLSGQDKDTPSDAGDKRMWRKWIEERLGKQDQTEVSVSKSFLKETASSSSKTGQQSGPLFTRRSFLKGYENPSSAPETVVNLDKRSSALDSAFKAAFNIPNPAETENLEDTKVPKLRNPFHQDYTNSSYFPDRGPNKNSSFGPRQGSFFQDSRRQPAFFSERQTPPKGALDDLPVEPLDDFEYRVLGSPNDADDQIDDDFLNDLDEIGRSARGLPYDDEDDVRSDEDEDWGSEKVQGLTDLALSNAEEFDLEDEENKYRMRPDRLFFPGQTYDPEDLDLSKDADVEKPTVRTRKKFPTKEVFKIADFRNPRFLTNFIRESSRILPRRHYRISAKAQRKVAREIKTARMLGLMPFTSMGDPPFKFLRSRGEEDTNTSGRFDGYQDFRPFYGFMK